MGVEMAVLQVLLPLTVARITRAVARRQEPRWLRRLFQVLPFLLGSQGKLCRHLGRSREGDRDRVQRKVRADGLLEHRERHVDLGGEGGMVVGEEGM